METVSQQVKAFIVDSFLFGDEAEADRLGLDDSLLEQGVLDSTGVLELVAFLEGTFGIQLDDDELVPENLDTVRRIAAFIERKRLAAA